MKQQPIYKIVLETFSLLDSRTKLKSAFSGFISCINALLEFGVTLLVYPLVLSISNDQDGSMDKVLDHLPNWITNIIREDQTLYIALSISCLFIIKNVFFLLQSWWNIGFVRQMSAKFSEYILRHYMNSPFSWQMQKNPAELHRNVNNSVDSICLNIVVSTLNVATEILLLMILVSFMLALDTEMFLISCAFIGLAAFIYTKIIGSIASSYGKLGEESNMHVVKSLFHALGGLKEARLAASQDFLARDFARHKRRQAEIMRVVSMLSVAPRAFLEIILALVMMFGILWVTSQSQANNLAILGTFGVVALRLMPAAGRILTFIQQVRVGEAALLNIAQDLRTIRNNQNAEPLPASQPRELLWPSFKRCINVRDVSFSYEESSERSLERVSLTIQKGSCIGLVGASGAGKSTLVDVILGLLAPQQGEIWLDDLNISGTPDIWNGMLGYVPQSIYLLDDTIENNITFGEKSVQDHPARLQKAIKMAQLEDFLNVLDDGKDTVIGDRGVRLSGGQRQRIGIARALYHNPMILVMDEGTSALDGATEAKLTEAIERLRGTKTIILIAHRLSTIRHCDMIVLMESGKIAATGSYHTLLETNHTFAEMVRHADLN